MRRGLLATIVLMWVAPTMAQETKRQIGAWEVSVEKDRFNSGSTKVIAILMQGGNAVAVRCFPKGLSVAVGELLFGQGRFDEGMVFSVKFRADDKKIITTDGLGLSDKFIQIDSGPEIVSQMLNAKEYAFRLGYKAVTFDMVFKAGKGAREALGMVIKECPIPA